MSNALKKGIGFGLSSAVIATLAIIVIAASHGIGNVINDLYN